MLLGEEGRRFPKNSVFIRNSRTSARNSLNWARSDTVNGCSSAGCAFLNKRTQFDNLPSLTRISLATSTTGRRTTHHSTDRLLSELHRVLLILTRHEPLP